MPAWQGDTKDGTLTCRVCNGDGAIMRRNNDLHYVQAQAQAFFRFARLAAAEEPLPDQFLLGIRNANAVV